MGADNIFIFGLPADAIQALRVQGSYQPREYYTRYLALKRVIDALYTDRFCSQEPGLFRWIYHALLDHGDVYFHLADLPAYIDVQAQAGAAFTNPAGWTRKAILNVARMGIFSSDRTVRQYAQNIWQIDSIPDTEDTRPVGDRTRDADHQSPRAPGTIATGTPTSHPRMAPMRLDGDHDGLPKG